MTIEYYCKSVYGKDLFYIKDEEVAKNIQSLTGCKTIEFRHMLALSNLGFKFSEVIAPR